MTMNTATALIAVIVALIVVVIYLTRVYNLALDEISAYANAPKKIPEPAPIEPEENFGEQVKGKPLSPSELVSIRDYLMHTVKYVGVDSTVGYKKGYCLYLLNRIMFSMDDAEPSEVVAEEEGTDV